MAMRAGGRRLMLAAVCFLPLLRGGAALAQQAHSPQPVAAQAQGQGRSQGEADTATAVEEVVVTATRREETLSRVPVSISAFTTSKMDVLGIKSFADVVRYTPGVTFDAESNNISIRGINSTAGAGTTGIYIDDTPIQVRALGFNANNTLPAVFDLERVEVLRGPQGTLFGAGSEGGTVRYITPQPSLTRMSAYGRSELAFTQYGSPSYEGGAAVGGPLIADTLGFRISAWGRRDGGWIDRIDYLTGATTVEDANFSDTYVLRGALTLALGPDLLITPSIYYQNRHQHETDTFWVSRSDLDDGVFKNGTPDRMQDRDHFAVSSLKISYDAGPATFISNTAYFDRTELVNGYSGTLYNLSYFQQLLRRRDPRYPLLTADGINLPGLPNYVAYNNTTNRQENFTQELRLQSNRADARLTWVLGFFYGQNSQQSIEEINDPQLKQITRYLFDASIRDFWGVPLLKNGDDYINDTVGHDRQAAVFADVTWSLTEKLKLTGGLRYARTHFDFVNHAKGPQNFGRSGGTGEQDESPFTPKVGVSYQATDDNLYYITFAKGYRIGGANPPFPQKACQRDLNELQIDKVPSSYNSDTVMSYEAGAKNRFLDRRLSLSGSVFYVTWEDIQQANFLPSCGFQYTANLGSAVSKGFDLQSQLQVSDDLRLEMTLGYTDARYSADSRSGSSPTSPLLVRDGDALGGSPWTVTLAAQYGFTAFDLPGFARVDYEFAGRNGWLTPSQDPATTAFDPALVANPATHFVSARAGLSLRSWDVSLFMDNVLNSHPQLDLAHQDDRTLLFTATTFRPRTAGVTATYRY